METESVIINNNLKTVDYKPYFDTLDKLGFCICPAFDMGDIARLLTLYHDNFGNEKVKQLYATHNSNPFEKSLHINEEIRKIVDPKLQSIFPGYDYFIGHFMVKAANEKREFPLHQDWNIVDESKYKSYQVWIPLHLTYPANGGMFVVPGSHRFFNNYRSGSYDIPRLPFDERFKPIITNLNVTAGDILVYHNALFHASYPNTTNNNRIVVIVNYAEKKAPTYYFQKDEDKKVTELYNIDAEILVKNLPVLEKGFINDGFPFAGTAPMCEVENAKISAEDLVAAYHKNIGYAKAGQIKQVHIAKSTELESQLNDTGYAIIDLLNNEQIALLKQEYDTRFGGISTQPGRFTTLQSTNNAIKNEIHEFVVKCVRPSVDRFFENYFIPVSQFYTKKANTSGDIELHADSTLLLNHQIEPHYAIWVPLLDVGANNGALTVIPYSHRINNAVFGGTFSGYHYPHREWLSQFEVPLHLRAGQAVVFDNNLLHNSTANNTATNRVCVTFRLTHMASQYYSFYCENKDLNAFEIFMEEHNFYMSQDWDGDQKKPVKKSAGFIFNNLPQLQIHDLEKIFKAV